MPIGVKIAKISHYLSSLGIVETLKIIKKNLFFIKKMGWYEKNLESSASDIEHNLPLKIDFNRTDEIITWIEENHIAGSDNLLELEHGRKAGHYFPFVKHNNQIIGFEKIGFDKIYILDLEKFITLSSQVAFIYDTYILPEYRSLGIARFLTYKSMQFLKKRGFKRLYCHIMPTNCPSIKSFTHLGFNKTKNVYFLRILGGKLVIPNPDGIMIRPL